MNLLFKRIFGSLKGTEKFEKEEAQFLKDYKRYCDVAASEELKEYAALFSLIKSADFKEKKKTLQNRKYKDTKEYRDSLKYEKLKNSWKIKSYYETAESAALKEYEQFKLSPDFVKLGDRNAVQADERLKRLKSFETSKEYKNFEGLKDSYIIKEYESLKAEVNTEEFQERNEWWKDNKRWTKTEEYAKEQRFYALKKTENIAFYEKTDPKKFEKINEWALTFEDNFDGTSLDDKWADGFFHRASSLKNVYCFEGEKQANTDGENVRVASGELNIDTKLETKKGLVWNQQKGFVEKDFMFSSGVVNNGKAFSQKYGKVIAKIKVDNINDVNHAVWIGTDGMIPHINLFSFNGKNIVVGACDEVNGRLKKEKEVIKGITPSDYYIYTVEWNEREIKWSVNNLEVKKVPMNAEKAMHISAGSRIPAASKGGQSVLKIDWIKVYTHK